MDVEEPQAGHGRRVSSHPEDHPWRFAKDATGNELKC